MKRQQTTKLKPPMFKTLHDIEALTQFLFILLQNMKQKIPNHTWSSIKIKNKYGYPKFINNTKFKI